MFGVNKRRSRKTGQLALAAARLATAEDGRPKKTPPSGGVMTVGEVSKALGISARAIDRAKFILAEKRAVDELIEYLERGEITLGCAEWASQGHHKEQTEACADSAKAVRALATLVRARKESSKTAKKRKAADFDDGLREALEWVNRWGRYGPFAEICDAVVAVAERSRKIGGINEASAQA